MKFDVDMKYGIAIPKCARFEKVHEPKALWKCLKKKISYTQSRLKGLNINIDVKPDIFKMDCRAEKKSDSTSSVSTSESSFLFEQRSFELKLGN